MCGSRVLPLSSLLARTPRTRTRAQEGNGGVHDRTNFCAPVAMGDLVAYHWPSFRAALQRGGAGGIMCSANGVRGYPSCAHGEWNNGMLRGQWGWNGAMVTDGNGVGEDWRWCAHCSSQG